MVGIVEKKLTYRDSGVDIERANAAVKRIEKLAKSVQTENVIGSIGQFSGFFKISTDYNEPVLVSSTDGVGTKLKIAFMMDKHDTIGIDCVAMCVNDIAVHGATPLFFLDYIATGKIALNTVEDIVRGIIKAVKTIEDIGFSSLNFVLSDGSNLYALRYYRVSPRYYSLYYLRRPTSIAYHDFETKLIIEHKLKEGEKAVLIASEPLTYDEAWLKIPNKTLVIINSDLKTKIIKIR